MMSRETSQATRAASGRVEVSRERTSRVGAVLLGIGLAGGLLTLLAERL